MRGTWQSSSFGHMSFHAYDNSGKEIFKIRASTKVWNPLQWRWSFRVLPAGSKDNEDALFTINTDWGTNIWRIYRGHERGDDMVYYCYTGTCYKSAQVATHLSGNEVASWHYPSQEEKGIASRITVKTGEDTMLLLAVSTVMYMRHGI